MNIFRPHFELLFNLIYFRIQIKLFFKKNSTQINIFSIIFCTPAIFLTDCFQIRVIRKFSGLIFKTLKTILQSKEGLDWKNIGQEIL